MKLYRVLVTWLLGGQYSTCWNMYNLLRDPMPPKQLQKIKPPPLEQMRRFALPSPEHEEYYLYCALAIGLHRSQVLVEARSLFLGQSNRVGLKDKFYRRVKFRGHDCCGICGYAKKPCSQKKCSNSV